MGAYDRHDYEAQVEPGGNQRKEDRRSANPPASGCIRSLIQCAQWNAPLAITASEGGVCQEWYGAGEGNSHSRPCAPSHGLLTVTRVPDFTHLMIRYGNSSCDKPKPNPPIED